MTSAAENPVAQAAAEVAQAAGEVVQAADELVDKVTGLPPESKDIAHFTHGGATLLAETRHGKPEHTFVLIHGIGMGRKVFGDVVRHLAPHGTVITVDQPGYGEAPEPSRTLTMERTADLIAAFLVSRGVGNAVVIGHSMGTQVATEVAVRHPHLVKRLVLVAPTVDAAGRKAFKQLGRLALDLVAESPKVLLLGTREYLRAGPHLRRKMRAMLIHRPEEAYPKISVPTLVIRGGSDRVCPHEWCASVARTIPNARLVEIDGHRHETMIHNGEPAAQLILDDLARG